MSRMVTETLKKLFPDDFEELRPVKKRWYQKITLEHFKSKMGVYITLAAVAFTLIAIYYYNKFIELSRFTEMEQHQIEVQLQRRKDLSINLARTVIDYARHERMMFKYMADKRAEEMGQSEMLVKAIKQSGLVEIASGKGMNEIERAMSKFMALAEAYPELKLSANFQKLMDSLVNSENLISDRRMEYNRAASVFHAYVRTIPACFFAFIFGYKEKMFHYAEVDKDVKKFNRIKY